MSSHAILRLLPDELRLLEGEILFRPQDRDSPVDIARLDARCRTGPALRALAPGHLAACRDDAYEYVHFAGLPPLLFDIRQDPGELRNLAADPRCAPVMLDYLGRLLSSGLAYNRRELTGFCLKDGRALEAQRHRRIG